MKKTYLFLLMVFLAIGSGSLFAQQRVLDEDFESTAAGSLPDKWTQDPAGGASKWAVEKDNGSNLFDPAACADGKGRIKFQSNGTAGEFMLITPAIDISRLAEPILVFDYAAIRSTAGVVDSLKVYYRLRSDRDWVFAKSYGEADRWTHDTIAFTQKTTTFQIAFAVAAKDGGRGVALDEVHVTSRPICEDVTGVEVYNKTHNEAKLRWSGSLTATYHVIIATEELADPASATAETAGVLVFEDVANSTNMQINATANKALMSSTQYWYYIQSDCGYGDVGSWVSGTFTSACDPVPDFSTSFDLPEDLACWTTIGESHGTWIATRPNNVQDSVMYAINTEGKPLFMTHSAPEAHTGSSALWMPVKSINKDDYSRVYAVSPRLADDVNIKDMQLSFWMKTNTKQIHLRVIVSEWPDDFSNAEASGEIVARTSGIYEQFMLTFEDIKTDGKYVAFMIDGSEEILKMPQFPSVNIDDVVFEKMGECTADNKVVMFSAPEFTANGVTLRWNRTAAKEFNVKVSTSKINPANEPGVIFDDKVTSPEVPLSNLTPATRYFYYVQPICANGTVGTWSNAQYFDSECLASGVTLPLRENFDNIDVSNADMAPLPVCWSVKVPAGATGYGPYITSSAGANSPYNYLSATCEGGTFIVTPKINADLKECQVRFVYSIDSKAIPMEIGIMSDPTDDATFEKMGEVTFSNSSAYNNFNWEEALITFENYTGIGKYVAFKLATPSVNYKLDDIIVEDKANCAEPKNLHAVSASADAIVLDWTPSISNETEWDIAYGKQGTVFASTTKEEGITEHPYTLDGLDENVTYDIYIRSSCEGKGSWVGPFRAKTISPAKPDYICDFEDATVAGAWNLLNGKQDNQWIVGDAVKDEMQGGKAVGKTLYISSDYGMNNFAANKETYSYATRLFDLEAGLFDFEFDWRLPGAAENEKTDWYGRPLKGTNGIIIPFLVPENIAIQGGVGGNLYQIPSAIGQNSYQGIKWENAMPEGWIRLCDGIGFLAHHTDEWQHHKYTYPLRESGRYNLVIVFITPTSYGGMDSSIKSAAVDNVSVKSNTTDCIAPVDLVAFDVAQYSAKVRFLNYNADDWKVLVADSTYEISDRLDRLTTDSAHVVFTGNGKNPVELTDLEAETRYTAYIRPACGDANTWASIEFRTICPSADVPLEYTFDEPEFAVTDGRRTKTFMDCWRRLPEREFLEESPYFGTSVIQVYKFSSYNDLATTNLTQVLALNTGSIVDKAPGAYNGPIHAVSPEMKANVKDLMVSFRAVSEYDYSDKPFELEVGVMSDPMDTSTFELIETIKPLYKGQWKSYYVYFDSYEGDAKHIAFRQYALSNMTTSLYIDDLKIDSIKGCVPAREITVENITDNTADVSWKVVGSVIGDYHVKVTTEPIGRWEDAADVYEDTISGTNKVTLSKLRASKLYYVYVRTVCTEEGGYSVGISEAQFRTGCGSVAVLPFYEDFDTYEVNSMPDCWHVMQTAPDGMGSHLAEFNTTTILGVNYKQIGRLSLTLQTGSQGLFPAMVAMPAVQEDVKDLSVSFKALQGLDQLVVGVVSDINDPETFVAVDTIKNAAQYVWEDQIVDFADYTGNGKHIAFFVASSYFGSSFTIDNVMIRKAAMSCPDATAPQVLEITANSALIRWGETGGDEFEVKVSTADINPEIEEGDVLKATKVADLQKEVTGLKPATRYFAYMRNTCKGGDVGYWSDATEFLTACPEPETIPYEEKFDDFGDIADQGFFPVCWRSRVISYGSISPSLQPEPYIENSTRPSLFMKVVYDGADGAYAVSDAITPVIDFGQDATVSDHMMTVTFKSTLAGAPIYVGLMSDPSDATTFIAYDTLRNNKANTWETQIVNFIEHETAEQHIAFRINSLDGIPDGYVYNPDNSQNRYEGYQVNITDINVTELPDCMPPYRVRADVRPNRAFISWVPGDKTNKEWKYYYSDGSAMQNVPFTDEEFRNNNSWGECTVIDSTQEHRLVINGLEDWTDYYFYIKTNGCEDKFYPQEISLAGRPTCSRITSLAQLPIAPDFMNNGLGIGAEPEYSSYFDCWMREDDFVGDTVAYPYINEQAELLFHTVADSTCYAYLPEFKSDGDTVAPQTQLRFSAKGLAEGTKLVIGFAGHYTMGWPAEHYFEFEPQDTIELTTEYEEYTHKFDKYTWAPADPDNWDKNYQGFRPAIAAVTTTGDFVINELSLEEIPYCYTPALTLREHDKTTFEVSWEKLDDQERWEVAYGEQGFDLENAKLTARTDTFYNAVNLTEGTPYEFFVRSNCGNGMTSEWGRICVTTDQTPAEYPYTSLADFADATMIDADDSLYYAYRTVELPAGPHALTFDWKVASATGAYLRVFTVPANVMITGDTTMLSITETGVPEGWTEVKTLKGNTAWTAETNTMYVKVAEAGAVNVVFVWTNSGADVKEVVRNVKIGTSTDCTVPDALSATQITASTAVLNWVSYNANSWTLDYWETADKQGTQKTILDDVKPGYKLEGLKADMDYTFQVTSDCKGNEPSEEFAFHTACATIDTLYETFDDGVIGGCWSQYHGLFDEVISDPNKLLPVETGWDVTTKEVLGSGGTPNARLTIAGADCANWLVSPTIKLNENSALSFDLAFTAYNGQQPVAPLGQQDDRFIVAVSADEGRTWKTEDATIWNNAEDVNKILNNIGNHSRRMEIDLSPYTGKTVRVAFYGESTVEFETNDIHIDSVTLECRTVETIEDSYCNGYSYQRNGFTIDRDDIKVPGVHKFVRKETVAGAECNKTVVLELTVKESKEYRYEANICSDETYIDENFKMLSESGIYTRQLTADNGCDSVVVLELTVNEAYSMERSLTIDASELPYEFECHLFPVGTTTGEYEVNCPTVAGCDSIISLKLTVNGGSPVDNVEKGEVIVLTPSPVRGGDVVTVNYEFTAEELKDMVVTVYNSVGQAVEVSTPAGQPVAFNAPHAAGVYTVRIMTGTDSLFIGRFIVR